MPYIQKPARWVTEADIEVMSNIKNPGKLNFTITKLIDRYLVDNELCYKTINEIIGVLECAKMELYRRVAAPYEDEKIKENGDVYSLNNLPKVEPVKPKHLAKAVKLWRKLRGK